MDSQPTERCMPGSTRVGSRSGMEGLEGVVVALMNGGDRRGQVEAAVKIGQLDTRQKRELAERGAIGPLISILRFHRECAEAIEAALFALLALAFGSERNKVQIVKFGAIPVLLDLMRSRNGSVIELSVAAIMILSSCSANRPAIASSEIVAILGTIIGGISWSAQAKLDAITTLQNLVKFGQTVFLLVSQGGVSSLVDFIIAGEKSSEAVEKAVALLEAVAESSVEALEETVRASGSIQALVEIVEEGSMQGKEHAAAVLFLAACQGTHRAISREWILQEGAVPGLMQLSIDGAPRGREIARRLLMLLRERDHQAAGKRKATKKRCSQMEFMEDIMREIDADEDVGEVTAMLSSVEMMVAKLRRHQPVGSSGRARLRFAQLILILGRFWIRPKRGS